jgi:hypothetical protein
MTPSSYPVRPGRAVRNVVVLAASIAFWLLPACGNDDEPGPTNTGQSCSAVDQCYAGVEEGELLGDAVCLDRVEGGYCTHHCTQDSDCCAAAGECVGDHAEVCGPFESTDDMYCFLSCEEADVDAAQVADADSYCQRYASAAFHCRSTGGGAKNRKVCMP